MSSLVDNQNMYGFTEVPTDAFSEFDLSISTPITITRINFTRTYKANCTICLDRCHTSDSNNRFIVCCICNSRRIPLMQSFIRRYLVCKKLKRIRNQELAYRWFTTKDINGGDFSRLIGSFL